MRRYGDRLRLSATDLANHLGCAHSTVLDRAVADGLAERPRRHDVLAELLKERGLAHERAYLGDLRTRDALTVVEIPQDGSDRTADTLAAMKAGADAIYQAPLGDARWYGRADFLLKRPKASALGGWSYEVVDAKLATETRAGTILQLGVYSELVGALQGRAPEHAYVVAPHHGYTPARYRLADYGAYQRLVKRRLEAALDAGAAAPYPDPVEHCAVCQWWSNCNARRRADDHLCFVAGISRLQVNELRRLDIGTLERLGRLRHVPKPGRGSRDALARIRDQAAIQLRARETGERRFEILEPVGEAHGFALLPAPSEHDVFLDLEGDRLAQDGGREYLFGFVTADAARPYERLWATTPAEEKRAFETCVDTILAAFRAHPDMHVYHFGAYEPAAFKRLSGRHATREAELDTLLRAEVFVDLHTIVRHALRASVESYSIKELEPFFGLQREQDLREATASRRAIEWAIEMRDDMTGREISGHVEAVERYNREDCVSARELRRWLEALRARAEHERGIALPRPERKSGDASAKIEETAEATRRVMAELLEGVPVDPDERSPAQQAHWLMAHLLEWHRREDKAAWWEYYRLKELPLEDYEDERSALAGLEYVCTVDGDGKKAPVHRYAFPPQDHDLRKRDEVCVPGDGVRIGVVENVDVAARTLDVKHSAKHADLRPRHIFVRRIVPSGDQPKALLELGRFIAACGIDAPGKEHRAARDLLLRKGSQARPPASRVAGQDAPGAAPVRGERADGARPAAPTQGGRAGGAPVQGELPFGAPAAAPTQTALDAPSPTADGDSGVALACRLASELDAGVLAIQGPPGTGKTYTGSHMIWELLKAGKRVGVTAVSHEVIRNLLKAVAVRAAADGHTNFKCLHKDKPRDDVSDTIVTVDDNERAAHLFTSGEHRLLGGTGWVWSRAEFTRSADVLFIDEAGQMSLADVLAVANGAANLVLLGDPQQLEQPQQASHPPGTEASALEHVLGGEKTIAPEQGLFLSETRRLHPSICAFTSEVFYEDKLSAFAGLERQAVLAPADGAAARFGAAGLVYVPVEHSGNQSRADEEVAAVEAIVAELTAEGVDWRDRDGACRKLTPRDVLVVAPYNAQVTALGARLPGVRVGTVDKFQGQEAPVVIVSLATSTPEDAPRGMQFLYSANRLNVATSRAKALCVLVGSPKLFEPDCRTPEQMRLANAFCRYLELARVVHR